jgi:hypothetical protein
VVFEGIAPDCGGGVFEDVERDHSLITDAVNV